MLIWLIHSVNTNEYIIGCCVSILVIVYGADVNGIDSVALEWLFGKN